MSKKSGRAWSVSEIELRYCAAHRSFDWRERPRGGRFAILIFSRAFVLGYVKYSDLNNGRLLLYGAEFAALYRCNFKRFCVRHMIRHSLRTASNPRSKKLRMQRTCFIQANTGSTIAARRAYFFLPSSVLSFARICCATACMFVGLRS